MTGLYYQISMHAYLKIISTHRVLNFINILGYGCGDGYGRQGCEEEDSFPDLTPFLSLSLVILGLSLLFPAIITITDVNTNTDNTNGMVAMDNGKRKRRFPDEGSRKKSINCAYFVHKLSSDTICIQFG